MTEKDIQYIKNAINWLSKKAIVDNRTEFETIWSYTHNSLELLDNLKTKSTECFKTPVVDSKQRVVCAKCAREIRTYKDACAPCRIADALLD